MMLNKALFYAYIHYLKFHIYLILFLALINLKLLLKWWLKWLHFVICDTALNWGVLSTPLFFHFLFPFYFNLVHK